MSPKRKPEPVTAAWAMRAARRVNRWIAANPDADIDDMPGHIRSKHLALRSARGR